MAKKFKCSKCKRTFSMAAHLARHVSAIHGKKTAKKAAKQRGGKAKRRVGRPKSGVTVRRKVTGGGAQLLAQMRAYRSELSASRRALDAEITALDRAMRALRVK